MTSIHLNKKTGFIKLEDQSTSAASFLEDVIDLSKIKQKSIQISERSSNVNQSMSFAHAVFHTDFEKKEETKRTNKP